MLREQPNCSLEPDQTSYNPLRQQMCR